MPFTVPWENSVHATLREAEGVPCEDVTHSVSTDLSSQTLLEMTDRYISERDERKETLKFDEMYVIPGFQLSRS